MTDDTARDEFPELATNKDWREAMTEARKERKLSQDELAEQAVAMAPDLLRGSQGVISRIENGNIGATRLVVPICRILGIPLPSHYVDDQEREWVEMWRRYREKAPGRAAAALAFLKSQLDENGDKK